ncbi:MAG: catechol 1,2-dioxygenase [Ilumatobacter sp.]|uniref:DODA-type extradiol aromatic ring-opening family dioxygenase n=1 Tax=Ilumatobacter sp. TaxID=1967498 RepID=UPI00391A9F06
MSAAVIGIGGSHTTLMNTKWDEVDHLARAHDFRDALGVARERISSVEADLVVILGSNHFRGFWLDLMPAFTVGVDQVIAAGEHGTPSGPQAVDPSAALAICEGLLRRDLDMAFSSELHVDHGISHAIQWIVPDGLPVVPIVINSFGPPLPTLSRCLTLGESLAGAIAELAGDRRVAVIATGGLSHQIPFPDWRAPVGDDEEFLARSFREGRGRWEEFEERRRPIVVGATPRLSESFDHDLLALLEAGRSAEIADRYPEPDDLVAAAGNGGNEIRAWLAMAAALGHGPGETLCYSPMPEWLTGMGVAVVAPGSPTR